ncbi:hypothetical protein CapIbe_005521 [Capra ibex]
MQAWRLRQLVSFQDVKLATCETSQSLQWGHPLPPCLHPTPGCCGLSWTQRQRWGYFQPRDRTCISCLAEITALQTSNGCGLRETDDGIIFMYLKQKIRKGSLPRYQQFLSDEDRRTWEYQQITKTGEET